VHDARAAARDLHALGARAVLVKGGHLARSGHNADSRDDDLVDVLCVDGDVLELPTPRVRTRNTHGTGCTLASAVAAHLARGASIRRAVALGQRCVAGIIAGSAALRIGSGPQGAMDHGARLGAGAAGWLPADPDYRLYAVTDPECNAVAGRSMGYAVRAAVAGGATMIQIREKNAEGGAFLGAVRAAVDAAGGVPVIVNDRADVALAAGAAGVHVGQSDLPCTVVRRLLPSAMLVGVSVSNAQEARQAARDGADYVGAGAVFATATKETSEAIGVEGLSAIVEASPVPVVAIGSIKVDNVAQVMASGCAGVAVVSSIFAAADVSAACQEFLGQLGGERGAAVKPSA
jgi:hydroxymethylpyrimidine kinase / phosphomethylpyrimidine kinase / thiamine-phosphate diphosphorylase